MAKQKTPDFSKPWQAAEEFFAAGSPEFVDAVRAIPDAERVGNFAARWYDDPRPVARQLLHQYLSRPLNAFRHEPLVKRLFKRAEAAGDDETMAYFLVALDRSVRRKRSRRYRPNPATGRWEPTEVLVTSPSTTLPRNDAFIQWLDNPYYVRYLRHRVLFSVKTRHHLRRRAWRYFRKLGRRQPERYLPGVLTALRLYTDDDTRDGPALLGNWGLLHVLFHFCPALESRPAGWRVAAGHSLAELAPAPMFAKLWREQPREVLNLLETGQCRAVRQWAIQWLKRERPELLAEIPLERLIGWLTHPSPEMVELASELLGRASGLERVPVSRWLKLIQGAKPEHLDLICDLIARNVAPERVTLTEAVSLAMQPPAPVALMGLRWLQGKRPVAEAEVRAVLDLREAASEPLRPELIRWACRVLGEVPAFNPEWVLEFLDSRHEDVRVEGWYWLQNEPRAREDVQVWQRLLETPYDEVRQKVLAHLEERVKDGPLFGALEREVFSPALVRFIWASVLLNIHRGGRNKPAVVKQLVERVARKPEDAPELLPVLGVALRSVRGPEFRAGLTGVVQLLERRPDLRPAVESAFPELRMI